MTSRFLKKYISILLFSLSLISCGPYYVDGKIIDLEEAYKKSLITKNDLLNIAFYVNGEKNLNQEEYELQELDYSLLDKSIQDSIKFSVSKFLLNSNDVESKPEDFTIMDFFGVYNNVYVVNIDYLYVSVDILYPDETISGIYFKNFYSSSYPGIVCWIKD